MAEGGVVIEQNLGIDAEHLALLGLHEGVDLNLSGLLLDEKLIQILHLSLGLGDLGALESKELRQSLRVRILHTLGDIDGLCEDLLGRLVSDGLDVHASLRRHDEHGTVVSAVEEDGEVQLTVEADSLVDKDLRTEIKQRTKQTQAKHREQHEKRE